MKRVYIAGPMRGYPMFNFPAFDAAELAWRARGWDVISPAQMDRDLDGLDPENPDPAVVKPFPHYMRRDIEALLKVDAVAFLPGWEKSTGANVEKVVGTALGLEMYDALTFEPLNEAPELRVEVPLCDALNVMLLRFAAPTHVHHNV